MITIEQLKAWVKEGEGKRCARVEIGESRNAELFKAWVYDYDLMTGQYITDMNEIDLKRKAREALKETMKKLESMGVE